MGKYIRGDVTLAGLHLKKLPEIFKDLTIEGNLFLNDNRYQHYLSMLVNLVIWKDVRHTLIN